MRMYIYVIRRVLLLFPVILGVMTITFVLVSALPITERLTSAFGPAPKGSPGYNPMVPCSKLRINKPGDCPNPLEEADAHKLGLDRPIWTQWAIYMYNSLTFQWGHIDNSSAAAQLISWLRGLTVVQALGASLPYTLELAAISLLIVLGISIPIGNLAAANRNRPVDQIARVVSFSGFALPAFLLGGLVVTGVSIMIIHFAGSVVVSPWCPGGEGAAFEVTGSWPYHNFCYPVATFGQLSQSGFPNWMPSGVQTHPTGYPTLDALLHHDDWLALDSVLRMLIPALVIAYGAIAGILRFVRNSMLEVMNLDYVRTARAKGVPEATVVKRHAGRNSLNVTITVLGLTFAFFVGGFPVIETVFNLNGVGRMLAYAVQTPLDYGLIFGSTLLFTYLVVFANIIVDVLYAYLDPRVRLG